ncbi:MAG TPA: UbiX family flavin prenyltransferase [Saprospiraceae bacterium]|nr:UbiX family flavin prenyltransferase [Saprospiraceae bacterium]
MNQSQRKVALALGGSSGTMYAYLLMKKLATFSNIHVSVVMSDNAIVNWELELGPFVESQIPFRIYKNDDFFAPFASGSARFDTLVICPCSMGLLGRIALGISNDLITRTADVMLKERRKLIIVPREAPYNIIHLENMLRLTQAGAIICPASPSFYSRPKSIEDLCNTIVDRVLDIIDLPVDTYRWGSADK